MKRIYTLLLLTLLAGSACEKLLDIQPEGTISGSVLTDATSIQQALNGAYYNLGGIHNGASGGELLGGDFIVIPMLLGHLGGQEITWESVLAGGYVQFANSEEVSALNDRVAANWLRAYETLSMVNDILANVSKIADNNIRNRVEGEALAMRGVLYFEMVRLWAPQYADDTQNSPALPLLTEPVLSVADIGVEPFATVGQVYTQAQTDLEQASVLLQPFGKNGTGLSYYACQAWLCRLHMQKNDYPAAVTAANNVINGNTYQLTGSALDAFNNPSNSTEDIFAIQQTLANNAGDRSAGNGITAFYSSLNESGLGVLGVLSTAFSSPFLVNQPDFEDEDVRGSFQTGVTATTPVSSITAAFYRNQINNLDELWSSSKYLRGDHVIPVIRLAEVHLNRAEALFESNPDVINPTALTDLNATRTRAGLSALQATDFADALAFYDALVLERKRELFLEGHLLHDLKRRRSYLEDEDIFVGSLFNRIDPLTLTLPVPQAERNVRGGG